MSSRLLQITIISVIIYERSQIRITAVQNEFDYQPRHKIKIRGGAYLVHMATSLVKKHIHLSGSQPSQDVYSIRILI